MDKLFKELIDIHGKMTACQELIKIYESSKILEFPMKNRMLHGCMKQFKNLTEERERILQDIYAYTYEKMKSDIFK